MAAEWHYAKGSQQLGPVPESELRHLLQTGAVLPDDLIWQTGMSDWQPARNFPHLFPAGASLGPPPVRALDQNVANTKLAAGICGIAIGSFGVHKFILGMTTPGVIMLVVSVATCGIGAIVMHVIGVVEGITYLMKSDEEFHETYMVNKKEWF